MVTEFRKYDKPYDLILFEKDVIDYLLEQGLHVNNMLRVENGMYIVMMVCYFPESQLKVIYLNTDKEIMNKQRYLKRRN